MWPPAGSSVTEITVPAEMISEYPSDRNLARDREASDTVEKRSERHRCAASVCRRQLQRCPGRGLCVGKTKREKGANFMVRADSNGLAVAVCITSASPHEVTLVDATREAMLIDEAPTLLLGDKAYDSDMLDERLRNEWGGDMITSGRANPTRPPAQDRPRRTVGALRRYRRCWKVGRLFAWAHNSRWLVVRYERHAANCLGLVRLGCMLILLRCFLRWLLMNRLSLRQRRW